MAYRLESKVLKLHYHDNRFYNTTERMIWFYNPRLNEVACNRNIFWQEGADPDKQPLFAWSGPHAKGIGFDTYRTGPATIPNRVSKNRTHTYFDY